MGRWGSLQTWWGPRAGSGHGGAPQVYFRIRIVAADVCAASLIGCKVISPSNKETK